ncbi:hypothetical protein [Abditibacterium utsteinense]|uniref:hypothetical protein n=1 Tax=Abditibacterium utsteinense TaxID=1960156 RepID=UPI001300364D|nr:hypothetical protein [Abditibacterium utsteinense]
MKGLQMASAAVIFCGGQDWFPQTVLKSAQVGDRSGASYTERLEMWVPKESPNFK